MKTKILSSKAIFLTPIFVALALLTFHATTTRANTIALQFTNHSSNTQFANTWGWAFSLTTNVLLTDLGFFDGNLTDFGNGTGDGLTASHVVTIWTSAGVPVPGAQATVPAGTSATYVDGFRYVSLTTPLLLPMGDYVIGADNNGGDTIASSANGITTASGVVYGGGRVGPPNAFPDGSAFEGGNFGPNFQFIAPPTNGVPEGDSSWILLALSLGGIFGLRSMWQRRSV